MREGEKIVVTDGEVNTFYPSLSPPSPLSLCKCTHVNIIYITSLSLSSDIAKMSVFMENGLYFPEEDTERGVENEIPGLDYLEDASRSVELVREEGRDGQLGSFGFTLIQEKPPRVGTVIPGKPNYCMTG